MAIGSHVWQGFRSSGSGMLAAPIYIRNMSRFIMHGCYYSGVKNFTALSSIRYDLADPGKVTECIGVGCKQEPAMARTYKPWRH